MLQCFDLDGKNLSHSDTLILNAALSFVAGLLREKPARGVRLYKCRTHFCVEYAAGRKRTYKHWLRANLSSATRARLSKRLKGLGGPSVLMPDSDGTLRRIH